MSHGIHSCQGEIILGFTEVIRESCVKQCFIILACKYKLQIAIAKVKFANCRLQECNLLLFSRFAMINGKEKIT